VKINTSSGRVYRLGRLRFSLSGEGGSASYMHSELASLAERAEQAAGSMGEDSASPAPRLVFEVVDSLAPITDYSFIRPLKVLDGSFRVPVGGFTCHVSALDDDLADPLLGDPSPVGDGGGGVAAMPPLHVALLPKGVRHRHRYAHEYQRLRSWDFLSTEETRSRGFLDSFFDYLIQIAQLRLGQSYIHASSVERDGEGTAFLAWGGIGKTSALVKLVTEHGFRFLSDDVGLVDDTGTLWRTPKRILLYAFNVEGEAGITSRLLSDRRLLDRASWAWHHRRGGPRGVRRQVSAERLFGAAGVARSAPLTRAFYLDRAAVSDFEVTELSTEELCRRAEAVVMHVIHTSAMMGYAIQSGHQVPILPPIDEVVEATRAVVRRAVDGVPAFNVRIPLATPPSVLAPFLLRLIEDSDGRAASGVGARGALEYSGVGTDGGSPEDEEEDALEEGDEKV
jgi:hypothetical protein